MKDALEKVEELDRRAREYCKEEKLLQQLKRVQRVHAASQVPQTSSQPIPVTTESHVEDGDDTDPHEDYNIGNE